MPQYTLGILTLGQAPREDVIPTFRNILGSNVSFLQRGALDNLSSQEMDLIKASPEDIGIETRLLSGESVLVIKDLLLAKLMVKAGELEAKCEWVLLLCSGQFPALKLSHPNIIQPIDFIKPIIKAIAKEKSLCIIGPKSDMALAPAQWRDCAKNVFTAACSPYSHEKNLESAASNSLEGGADVIFMDDMGFNEEQRQVVRKISGVTTINATSLTARVIAELF